jgi:hypothetical protein
MGDVGLHSTGARFRSVVLVIFFSFCSLSGAMWGLIVRTAPPPDPTIESLAVFPAAMDLATPTEKPPGLAGPTSTAVINSTEEGLLNYDFRTTDSPDKVMAFYKHLMQSRYGFKVWWIDQNNECVQVLTFLREGSYRKVGNATGWDKEYVSVTSSPAPEGSGQLYVEVRHQVREFTQ